MTEEFYKHIQEANLAFSRKINKVSVLSLLPFLGFYAIYTFDQSLYTLAIMIAYAVGVVIFTFSKIPISMRFRRILVNNTDDIEKTLVDLKFLMEYFQTNTFFNRIQKKQHEIILANLDAAYKLLRVQ